MKKSKVKGRKRGKGGKRPEKGEVHLSPNSHF